MASSYVVLGTSGVRKLRQGFLDDFINDTVAVLLNSLVYRSFHQQKRGNRHCSHIEEGIMLIRKAKYVQCRAATSISALPRERSLRFKYKRNIRK